MSDEHNKPETAPVAKAPRPRRTSAPKKTDTAPDAVTEHSTSETPPAGKTVAKPGTKRPSRSKSVAADSSVSSDEKAPDKPSVKPARKRAPKAAASAVTDPVATLEKNTDDAKKSPRPARATPPKSTAKPAARKGAPKAEALLEGGTIPATPAVGKQQDSIEHKTPAQPKARPTRGAKADFKPAASTSSAELTEKARPQLAPKPASPATDMAKQESPADNIPGTREVAAVEATSPASAEDDALSPPRKSRRGRRGGRGRGRNKNRQAAQNDSSDANTAAPQTDTDDQSSPAPLDAADAVEENQGATAASQNVKRDSRRGGKISTKAREKTAEPDDKPGRRKMFISVVPGEQVEVALVEEGVIGEYYLDMLHQAKVKGNIYKGVVHNVDTNLQAAFVNYGAGKNGFLQIDEIHPEYYLAPHEAAKGKKFPPIQKVIKPGQEVLVQVVKEPTGNKGAFLTTWLSLAGRFLVLTPGQEQIGVSRKVDNDEERSRLREMMNGIEPGEGLGVIIRTVSAGTSKTTLKNDLQYLKRVWKEIRRRGTAESAPALIYKESGLAERAVRDYLTEDVYEVWVDNESVAESLRETVALLFPRKEDLVRVHADVRQTLWERFNIQRQLEQIYSREVTLPAGGRLVFDQTEALMAIDINSGKISGKANFESMALKTNIEAAEAIARHLKLRDIGGQVVIDFIEMRDKNHVREVEKTLRNAMKNDRARHDVARMSSFGLMEIVRQRTGSSALAVTMEPCPCCNGTGIRRNLEWQSLQALRQIGRLARTPGTTRCTFEANTELGMYLLNYKRDRLREMEQQLNVSIEIRIQP